MTLQDCIAAHPDLISGDDFPDAFYFDRFIEGSNCTGFSQFHNNAFATQMLLSAKTFKAEVRPGERSFNATQFALGYASHMYADDVGFFSTAIAPSATYLNWLRAWTYMVAIDAATASLASARVVAVPKLPRAGGDFVAAVAADYRATVDASAPLISAAQVMECAAAWQFTLRDKTQEALHTLDATWRHQLVEFSPYNASDPDQALAQLAPAKACVSRVWNKYLALANAPGAKPGVLDQQVTEYIGQLFESGACEPAHEDEGTTRSNSSSRGPLGLFPEAG